MKLLALETSTEACSVALAIDGDVRERFVLAPKTHTQLILPMIDELLAEAQLRPQQLDAIAFSRGPGSFTGVRIATGVMQGIALGADLPVVPVSTLAALAQAFLQQQTHSVAYTAMDARIGEIFWGVYQRNSAGFAELLAEEHVLPAATVPVLEMVGAGVGSGWAVYQEALLQRVGSVVTAIDATCLPHAAAIADLGV